MTDYEVLPGELRTHGAALDDLAERLGEALAAARQVSMSDDAYGKICQFLPPLLNGLEQQAYDALAAGQNTVSETATKIRYTADEYDRREDDTAVTFEGPR